MTFIDTWESFLTQKKFLHFLHLDIRISISRKARVEEFNRDAIRKSFLASMRDGRRRHGRKRGRAYENDDGKAKSEDESGNKRGTLVRDAENAVAARLNAATY